MKVLVTGSTGQIGKALIQYRPPDVNLEVLMDALNQSVPELPWYRADVYDRDRLVMAVTCAHPDIVIHLSELADVDECEKNPDVAFRINRDGTDNVAEACSQCGAKMVFISTDYVFDGRSGPYTEQDRPRPINVYGRSKLHGEFKAAERIDNLIIIRISVPFGIKMERVKHNFISWLIEELNAGSTVHVAKDMRTTPAFIEELVEVLWILVNKDVRGIVHYGTSDRFSRHEMALEICRTFGFSEHLVSAVTTEELGFVAKRPLESGFVTDKVQNIIGRKPILFRNALYRMIESAEMLV